MKNTLTPCRPPRFRGMRMGPLPPPPPPPHLSTAPPLSPPLARSAGGAPASAARAAAGSRVRVPAAATARGDGLGAGDVVREAMAMRMAAPWEALRLVTQAVEHDAGMKKANGKAGPSFYCS